MTLEELDRLAAEKVMGWEPIECGGYWAYKPGLTDHEWQPTRNIAQAWECLEKCGFKYFITGLGREVRCNAEWHDEGDGGIQEFGVQAIATTAAEAIVRAVLKAKGVEIE